VYRYYTQRNPSIFFTSRLLIVNGMNSGHSSMIFTDMFDTDDAGQNNTPQQKQLAPITTTTTAQPNVKPPHVRESFVYRWLRWFGYTR
jgi:hypothetical protein